jgi:8-oxo-dGTP diphosphatase
MKADANHEKAMFDRKNNFLGYRFCPRCGEILERVALDGRERMKCGNKNCDFVYYHNPIPAAGALVIKDDKILLVKRAVIPRVGWRCLPAGFMEWNEHPSQTAKREVKEETGIEIRLESLFEVYSGNDDPRMNAVLILYVASETGGTLAPDDDAMEVRYFGFEELPEKIAFESHIQAIKDYDERYRQRKPRG